MLTALLAFGRGMCCTMRVRARVTVSSRVVGVVGKAFFALSSEMNALDRLEGIDSGYVLECC